MGEDQILGLIVDDQPEARLEIRECAEVLGYDFIETGSVEEAREVLRREHVDFVVLDLSIPFKKGRPDKIEFGKILLDKILQEHPGVGVVVVTAHESYYHAVDIMRRSSAVSAVSFVPKPFDDNPGNPSLTKQIGCRSAGATRLRSNNKQLNGDKAGKQGAPRVPMECKPP